MVAAEAGSGKVDRRQIKRQLGALTHMERACLYLWAEKEVSIETLARVFGWTEEKVRITLDRAQGKLQALAGG